MGRFEDTINSMIDIGEKKSMKFSSDKIINLLIPAYNRYIKDNKNGDGYIFDLENKKDVINLIKRYAPIHGMKGFISLMQKTLLNNERFIIVSNNEYHMYNNMALIEPIELLIREILYNMILMPSIVEYKRLYHEIFFNDMNLSHSRKEII